MRYVVVGGGVAGVTAAQKLRALAPAAAVTIIEAEPVPYYIRPGLIEVLAGKKDLTGITPYPKDWFEKRGIDYLLGKTAVGLDLTRQGVVLSGERIGFDRLLLATGAEPVRPAVPGVDRPGVFTLRSAKDVEDIRSWAEGRKRAVILGGSWLGLEAAWALKANVAEVVVLERGHWPFHNVLDQEAGAIILRLLARVGITVYPGAEATQILGNPEVRGVRSRDGREILGDLVLVAIGAAPRTELGRAAGLAVDRGLVVDDLLCTSHPDVFGAGDVVEWFWTSKTRFSERSLWAYLSSPASWRGCFAPATLSPLAFCAKFSVRAKVTPGWISVCRGLLGSLSRAERALGRILMETC